MLHYHTEETATAYRPYRYEFSDIDVNVLEGVFLLKRELRGYYDTRVWVDGTLRDDLFPGPAVPLPPRRGARGCGLILPNDPRLNGR